MSRSVKKFYKITTEEVIDYVCYTTRNYDLIKFFKIKKRNTTINTINTLKGAEIYQGKVSTIRMLSKYHVGLKLGSLVQTKKPFFFRPKKVKKK